MQSTSPGGSGECLSAASGGPITRLAIDVPPGAGTATCRVGVYNAFNGQPSTLIADGGTLSGAGMLVTSGALSPRVRLAPQTLYFIAVGCNGTVTLLGAVNNSGALAAPLIGAPNYIGTTSQISVPWTFGALPPTFANGATITSASGSIPNVYAEP